jgi:predicted secreted protein
MAFAHGKDGYFALGTSGSPGTAADISEFLDGVDFPQVVDLDDTTTFGKGSRTYLVGLKDATISSNGNFDPTVDAALAGVYGLTTAVAYVYGPAGNAAGAVSYAGTCFVTTYATSTGVDSKVTFSLSMQSTGDVTRSLFA